ENAEVGIHGMLGSILVRAVMHPHDGHQAHDEVDDEDDDEPARRSSERRRDSHGSNRIGGGRDEHRRKADNERERAEDDVQNQVDVVSPDPANRFGLHNDRWPIRDRRPDRPRSGHRTEGAPQSIKVSLKLKPTWERSRISLDAEPFRSYRSDPPRRARSACSTTSRAVGVTSNSPSSRISMNRASSASLPGCGSPWR